MQMNSCEICRDLIPLVADNVAESSSKEYVMQHISHCESCRQYYQEVQRTLLHLKVSLEIESLCNVFALLKGIAFFDFSQVAFSQVVLLRHFSELSPNLIYD